MSAFQSLFKQMVVAGLPGIATYAMATAVAAMLVGRWGKPAVWLLVGFGWMLILQVMWPVLQAALVSDLSGRSGALERWLPVSAMIWQALRAPGYGCFFAAALCDRPRPVNSAG